MRKFSKISRVLTLSTIRLGAGSGIRITYWRSVTVAISFEMEVSSVIISTYFFFWFSKDLKCWISFKNSESGLIWDSALHFILDFFPILYVIRVIKNKNFWGYRMFLCTPLFYPFFEFVVQLLTHSFSNHVLTQRHEVSNSLVWERMKFLQLSTTNNHT